MIFVSLFVVLILLLVVWQCVIKKQLSMPSGVKGNLLESVLTEQQTIVSIPLPTNNPKLIFKIDSSVHQGVTYIVDVPNQICTCDDFLINGQIFNVGDLRRCCRHLLRAYCYQKTKTVMASIQGYDAIPEYVWAIILDGHSARKIWVKNAFGYPVAFTKSTYNSEWLNVFLKRKRRLDSELRSGKYERLGFSVVHQRWSYGQGPKGVSKAIREMIRNMNI